MLTPKPVRTSIWSSPSSRLYYAHLLQHIRGTDTASQRSISYTARRYNENQQNSAPETLTSTGSAAPAPTWPPAAAADAKPIVYSTNNGNIMPHATGAFSDLFTSLSPAAGEDASSVASVGGPTVPLYDASKTDSAQNPSVAELTARIQLELRKDPDNIWKVLGSSYLPDFETLEQRLRVSEERFDLQTKFYPAAYVSMENLSFKDLLYAEKLSAWQFKRYVMLERVEEMMREAQDDLDEKQATLTTERENWVRDYEQDDKEAPEPEKKPLLSALSSLSAKLSQKSARLSKFRYVDFSKLEFLGLSHEPSQRVYLAAYAMLNESQYIREMTRLYQLTGVEALREHVHATTPVVQRVCQKLVASYTNRADQRLQLPGKMFVMLPRAERRIRTNYNFLVHEAKPFAYLYQLKNGESGDVDVPEAYLNPLKATGTLEAIIQAKGDPTRTLELLAHPVDEIDIEF